MYRCVPVYNIEEREYLADHKNSAVGRVRCANIDIEDDI